MTVRLCLVGTFHFFPYGFEKELGKTITNNMGLYMFKRLSSKNYDKLCFLFTKYITNKCLIKCYENKTMFKKFQKK